GAVELQPRQRSVAKGRYTDADPRRQPVARTLPASRQLVGVVAQAGHDLEPLVAQLVLDIGAPDRAAPVRIEQVGADTVLHRGKIVMDPVEADGQLVMDGAKVEIG